MNLKDTCKKNRILIGVIIAAAFMMAFVYNVLTPYMSDDLWYHPGEWISFGEVWAKTWTNYMTWNGRLVPQYLMALSLNVPKMFFNIVNSLMFVALGWLIYFNIIYKKTIVNAGQMIRPFMLSLIYLALWNLGIDPGQTLLWIGGACNYLWATVISLGFMTLYRFLLDRESVSERTALPYALLMLILGFLAGFCNENTSGAIMLLTVYYAVAFMIGKETKHNLRIRKLPLWAYCGIIGEILGLIGLVVSPGGKIRLEQNLADESNTGMLAYLGRLLKLNDYVLEYLWAPCLAIIVLIVYMCVCRNVDNSENYDQDGKEKPISIIRRLLLFEPAAYILASIAAIYVLLATTTPMPRALFGAQVLLFIACGKLIVSLWEVSWVKTFFVSLVVGWALFTGINYVENAANLVRINRELNEREALIEEQRGADVVVVPRLRTQWDNKYTFIYPNDLTDDPENERNVSTRIYYDLNCIVAMDREEWEQTTDK